MTIKFHLQPIYAVAAGVAQLVLVLLLAFGVFSNERPELVRFFPQIVFIPEKPTDEVIKNTQVPNRTTVRGPKDSRPRPTPAGTAKSKLAFAPAGGDGNGFRIELVLDQAWESSVTERKIEFAATAGGYTPGVRALLFRWPLRSAAVSRIPPGRVVNRLDVDSVLIQDVRRIAAQELGVAEQNVAVFVLYTPEQELMIRNSVTSTLRLKGLDPAGIASVLVRWKGGGSTVEIDDFRSE